MSSAPVIVGLVEITEPADFLVYLPYAIGLLQAYAQAHAAEPGRYRFLPLQFQRKDLALAAAELGGAQIVGFSTYLWNYAYNLNLAKRLKQRHPEQLIVFGGPQIPNDPGDFLAQHPYVDICVHGEGEITFLRLLEAWPGAHWTPAHWAEIPGISYRDPRGECVTHAFLPRNQQLDEIPSPYLSGVFDALMAQHPQMAWSGIWETNRGCPFSCTFCDWGTINSKVIRFDLERVKQEIVWFGQHRIHFLFSADANFGILPRDLEIAEQLVASSQRYGFPKKVVTQMTKNQADRAFEAHRILNDGGLLMGATVSFQAVNANVLTAIKRDNISLEVYRQLLRRFGRYGIRTYTDILIGLPGETYDSFAQGLADLITMGQHDELRFFYTYLLPNSEMSTPAYRDRYGIETIRVPFYSPYLAEARPEELFEEYEMVVATKAMPREEWVRARALAWLIEILYYRNLMQLPLLLVHGLSAGDGQVPHREILRGYFESPLPPQWPVLQELRSILLKRATAVMQGQPESLMTRNPRTGQPVWMTITDYVTAQLVLGPKLEPFYQQSGALLESLLAARGSRLPPGLLNDALRLARALFETRLPHKQAFCLELGYNLWDCYQQIRRGEPAVLKTGRWQVSNQPDAGGQDRITEACLSPQTI